VNKLCVLCDGRIVATVHCYENKLMVEMTSGRTIVLLPPESMIFSSVTASSVTAAANETVSDTLRKAGLRLLSADGFRSMKEMATEYRLAAARLAIRIKEKKAAGADPKLLHDLYQALRDIREAQRILDGYYDVPRPVGPYTLTGMAARRSKDDH